MKLLVAGDSYALFSTPEQPNYNSLEAPKTVEGCSFGELLSKKLKIPVESSAIPGAANPMTVINALRHILQSQSTDQPITHCIFHYTQSSRISSNCSGLERALKNKNMTHEEYFKHSFETFFKTADAHFTLDQIILEYLTDCDFAAGNLSTGETEKFSHYLIETPIAKIVSDNFAYLSLLENCCKNLNIKLIVFSMFVTTKHLFVNDIFDMFSLKYATRFEPKKSWHYYSDVQCKTNNLDKSCLVTVRPGNHLYPNEHRELANDILRQHPNFFR